MKLGIPQGLLYSKYHIFAESFFEEVGAELIISPNTNKEILNAGAQYCVDDACLPIKVFQGHVSWLCGKCEIILIPRFVNLKRNEYICPMFCGLCEMVKSSLPDIPPMLNGALHSLKEKDVFTWAESAALKFTRNRSRIKRAFQLAMDKQRAYNPGFEQRYRLRVAVIGHAYIIFDSFVNMNLIQKLNRLGIGAVTMEYVREDDIAKGAVTLFKRPFWYFAGKYYGAATHFVKSGEVDGIIYVSAFSCGVDSVVVELIRAAAGDFPLLLLKIDEHTGEAGYDTRLEAFADMLKRRDRSDNHFPANGNIRAWSKGAV